MRILSIQSHVVHGYVGNKASTFPLQITGHEIDALNTVQFSTHTQYPTIKGLKFTNEHLLDIYEGLCQNGITYDCIITGYCGSALALRDIVKKAKERNVLYLFDPVLGDNGKMYVSEDVVEVFKGMVKSSDIITPNDYEIEKLTGVKVYDLESAVSAVEALHRLGAKNIVLTSFPLGDELVLVGSCYKGEKFKIKFKKFDAQFTGTGDLFAALLIAYYHRGLKRACEIAITIMQKVLLSTFEKSLATKNEGDKSSRMRNLELNIIECRECFLCEDVEFEATNI